MYECKNCGNKKYFIEHICLEREITLDPETGEFTGSHDTKIDTVEIVCGVCGVTSEDGDILDRNTNEPVGDKV